MIKESMNLLGYNVGKLRLPLYNTSKKNIADITYTLKELNLLK